MLSFSSAVAKAFDSFKIRNIQLLSMTLIVYLSTFFFRNNLFGLVMGFYLNYVYFQTVYKFYKHAERSFKAFFKPSLNIFSFSLFLLIFMIISSVFSYLVYLIFITRELFFIDLKFMIAGLLLFYLVIIYLSIRFFPALFLIFEEKNPIKVLVSAWSITKKFQLKLFVFFGLLFFIAAIIIYGSAYLVSYNLIFFQAFESLPFLFLLLVFLFSVSFFIQQFFMVFLFDLYQQLIE